MGFQQVCLVLMLLFAALGNEIDFEEVYRWKLSFDGTDCGDKSLLAFFLVPLSLGFNEQSSATVQLLGLGWGSESAATLNGYLPDIAAHLAYLHLYGLEIPTPDGVKRVRMRVDIGADLSSIWKATGIGSGMAMCSCLYCAVTKLQRQVTGQELCDLMDPANWRVDEATGTYLHIFGLSAFHSIHQCSLHGLTRISEKLMKLLTLTAMVTKELLGEKKKAAQRERDRAITEKKRCAAQRTRAKTAGPKAAAEALVAAAEAVVDVAEEGVAAVAADLSRLGSTEAISAAMVQTGVRNIYTIETTPHKRDASKKTLQMSTLTGGQSLLLMGRARIQVKEQLRKLVEWQQQQEEL